MWKKFLIIVWVLLTASITLTAQKPTSRIRGTVVDKITGAPLPGANVVLLNAQPFRGTTTDAEGKFILDNVPVGRVSLRFSFVGYNEAVLENLLLVSARELILRVELEEKIVTTGEVVITASADKRQPINPMATVSTRGFTIEETQRFAGSRNDVARMASNYAGVMGTNDARNDIIIRGNSPLGLLWRLEGVEIPNPNHYGSFSSTGGPVSILNNNTLANSDFLTGAFPAEYGNALSGVFDLKMRNGNDARHEFLGQVGFNGFEIGAEGPWMKSVGASYLLNVRYSTLEVMEKLGADLGTGTGVPRYKDLNLKIHLPKTRAGSFSLFAIGGKSDIEIWDSRRDTLKETIDFYGGEGYDLTNSAGMFATGISHRKNLSLNTFLRSTIALTYRGFFTQLDSLSPQNVNIKTRIYNNDLRQNNGILTTELTSRLSTTHTLKGGIVYKLLNFNLFEEYWFEGDQGLRPITNFKGHTSLGQAFGSWQYRITDNLVFTNGLHFMYFHFNQTWSLEPRSSLKWSLTPSQTLTLGYGEHSQTNEIMVYFRQTRLPDGTYRRLNENLDLVKARHLIASYDLSFSSHTHLKIEAYLQWLRNAAVDGGKPSYFSLLNQGANFGFGTPDTLVSKGTGFNKGLELTLERFLNKGLYYLLTASWFDSKYKGSDGVERNTAFNGRYVVNALVGKEFQLGRKKEEGKLDQSLLIDIKYTLAGGQRYTPSIVVPDPATHGQTFKLVFDQTKAYALQYKDYNRLDLRLAYRRIGHRVTQEWALDVQNLFNTQNVFSEKFNKKTGEKSFVYQMGLLVIPQYRIYF